MPNRFWLFTKNEISHFVRNDKPVVVDKGKKKGGKAKKVTKVGLQKEKGYLYFIDKKGNVSRAIMKNSGGKKKK